VADPKNIYHLPLFSIAIHKISAY